MTKKHKSGTQHTNATVINRGCDDSGECGDRGLSRRKRGLAAQMLDIVCVSGGETISRLQHSTTPQQVSQMINQEMSLSSTTDAIEGVGGHVNQATPKRRPFWRSMPRIVPGVINSTNHCRKRPRHSLVWARKCRTGERSMFPGCL
jgi:hypothetical protein